MIKGFICDPELLVELIQLLTLKTKEHKIRWYHNDDNLYYISNIDRQRGSLRKFYLSFDEESITVYVEYKYNDYTNKDEFIWEYLKKLKEEILKYEKSINAVITSMWEDLSII